MTKNKNTNFQYIPLGSFINIPFTLTVKILLAIGRVFLTDIHCILRQLLPLVSNHLFYGIIADNSSTSSYLDKTIYILDLYGYETRNNR